MLCPSKTALAAGFLLLSAGLAAAAPAVVGTNLKLRAGPGGDFAVLTVMPAGARVNVINCGGGWCRVSFAGLTGYASANYLAFGGPARVIVPPPVIVPAPIYVRPYPYYYRFGPSYRYRFGPRYGYGPRFYYRRHWRR